MSYPQVQPPQSVCAQPVFTSVASPSGTTSSSYVAVGLAVPFTPLASGRVKIDISTICANNTIGDQCQAQIIYGTGTAPTNGASTGLGTAVGSVKAFIASTAAGQQGCSFTAVIPGLTLGTAYWFDLQFKAVSGGTATFTSVDTVVYEI